MPVVRTRPHAFDYASWTHDCSHRRASPHLTHGWTQPVNSLGRARLWLSSPAHGWTQPIDRLGRARLWHRPLLLDSAAVANLLADSPLDRGGLYVCST